MLKPHLLLLRVFSSLGTSCVLLLLLGLLTFLGTLAQVEHGLYEVQKRYFESLFLVHRVGSVPIPLPGATLVLILLAANLITGGVVRLRKGWRTAGVLVTHLGILILLASGLVKTHFADEGNMMLFEGQSAAHYESYQRWELVLARRLPDGRFAERVAPQEAFADATDGRVARLEAPDVPVAVEVRHFLVNSRVLPKGPMFTVDVPVVGGLFLRELGREKEAEQNIAGAYVTLVGSDGSRHEGLAWGAERAPFTARIAGEEWAVALRKERYPLPFTVSLVDFQKEEHPGTDVPRHFSSDVLVTESGVARPVHIKMNHPLRTAGLVFFQASWGPSTARPGDPLFSIFAVVRNPADQWPLVGCIVIGLGLLYQFGSKLWKWISAEVRTA